MADEKKTAQIIIGVMGVLLILSNGGQYLLNETGKTSRCYSGWEFVEFGENEGQYACSSSSGIRYEYCSEVYDSKSGRENFYCKVATLVPIKDEPPKKQEGIVRESYRCYPEPRGCERIE